MLTIQRQTRDTKGASGRMEQLTERIANFSRRFQGQPGVLSEQAWQGFATRNPAIGLWALLNEYDEVVGHAIASVIPWGSEYVGWLYQLETDVPASREEHDVFLIDLEQWAHEWNTVCPVGQRVRELKFQTPHEAKAMARHSGFTPEAVLLHRRLT